MKPALKSGKIITFYSYKGGTGRSMALANVAWILAANRKRVLVLDWDLEAPGLHRYFRPFLLDKDLTSSEGIIDFVSDFADEAITPPNTGEELPPDWYVTYANILHYAVSLKFPEFPEGGAIDFVPAGRQGTTYATRVNSFNWQTFYDRLGGWAFLEETRRTIRENYDYILIDSRTGVSDTAGICTVQMPDSLVVLFTYNNQSIEGAAAIAHSVYEQQTKRADGLSNGFTIFPVATRVDQAEQDKLAVRRNYAQAVFDRLIEHIPLINRKTYWGDVEVPYIPYLAYEEILAPLKDDPSDPKNSLSAMIRLTRHLTGIEKLEFNLSILPTRRQEILLEFARTPELSLPNVLTPPTVFLETVVEEQIRLAEAFFSRLPSAKQNEARQLWVRLVRIARPEDGSEHSKLRVRLRDLDESLYPLVDSLVEAQLFKRDGDRTSGESTVEVTNEALIRNWERLHE
jgi:MinD-like ATPase involved in chromosome partitioning or flagellar assembly